MEVVVGGSHHFSHHHPLHRTNAPPTGNSSCHGCKLDMLPGNEFYSCKSCKFCLHQVCYNMPKKTRHPAHPDHYLTLVVSPNLSKIGACKCKACGLEITGFHYNCLICGVYYHTLCTALPLSISITSHPHTLKIQFSPPYDFCCDLCNKPSYNGWLYRCRFCEFDAHIACASANQRVQTLNQLFMSLPSSFTSQIMHSSASLTEANRKIDHVSEGKELMQLVLMGVTRGIRNGNIQQSIHSAVAGWDQRLHSPRKGGIGSFGSFGRHQPKSYTVGNTSKSGERSREHDLSTSAAADDLTIPSYQFSDLCFSIDFAKSSHNNEALKRSMDNVPEVVKQIDRTNVGIHSSTVKDSRSNKPVETRLKLVDKPVYNPLYRGPEGWLDEAFLAGVGTHNQKQFGHTDNIGKENKSERVS
ncbi:uncharacterized protein LOC120011803 [Tripterygium wilfordii]|uniref:uncharacterized protein LOC120011803 n=1 Tax=Tripterygium wilfordii TaxID=458696 RepID=UPI0018F7FF39|nr:uncharacterized protein LOC120011803 [Tripterygium wilfordii]